MNIAILGALFGDEGKGAFTHFKSRDFDWIVRYGGGANAGHTLYRDGVKFVHNLLPSIDFRYNRPKAYLGAGMVIDLDQLHYEVSTNSKIYKTIPEKIYVDKNAFVVLPEHKEEDKNMNGHIGTTNRGIGPAYSQKIARKGKRVKDMTDNMSYKQLVDMGVNFVTSLELYDSFKDSKCLFEGAQGVLLDINFGTYPFVSSSDTTISGIGSSGFNFLNVEKVYGITKAYMTRVGNGPFPTEIFGDEAEDLRNKGAEFGATTGRPRRVGWLDLPAIRYSAKVGGISKLVITKFDILYGMDKVPVATSYKNGEPISPDAFFKAEPEYSYHKLNDYNDVLQFIKFVERETDLEVSYITDGVSESNIKSKMFAYKTC